MGRYFVIGGSNSGSATGAVRYDQAQELTADEKLQAQANIGIDMSAKLERQIVSALPTEDIKTNVIYMVPNGGTGENVYDEYMYISDNWERIGSTSSASASYDLFLNDMWNESSSHYMAEADRDTIFNAIYSDLQDGKSTTIVYMIDQNSDTMRWYDTTCVEGHFDSNQIYIEFESNYFWVNRNEEGHWNASYAERDAYAPLSKVAKVHILNFENEDYNRYEMRCALNEIVYDQRTIIRTNDTWRQYEYPMYQNFTVVDDVYTFTFDYETASYTIVADCTGTDLWVATLNITKTDRTMATQAYVDEQIGNINNVLASI